MDKNDQIANPFSFMKDKKAMEDTMTSKATSQPHDVTQSEFDEKAGNKREVFDFLVTRNLFLLISLENIFLPDIKFTNMDYLGGIMDDTKR